MVKNEKTMIVLLAIGCVILSNHIYLHFKGYEQPSKDVLVIDDGGDYLYKNGQVIIMCDNNECFYDPSNTTMYPITFEDVSND